MYTDSLSKVGKISIMSSVLFTSDERTMVVRGMQTAQNQSYLELGVGYKEDYYGSLVLVTISSIMILNKFNHRYYLLSFLKFTTFINL